VIYLDNYDYDVAFYAHLDVPITVVDAWLPAEVAKDSWRRELLDAERFASADSPQRLLRPEAMELALCRSAGAWIVASWPAPSTPQWLTTLPPVYRSGRSALWHIEAGRSPARLALGCETRFVRAPPATPTL
jgi:hypothetical protein